MDALFLKFASKIKKVTTTAQLHPTKSKLRFCTDSSPNRNLSEIRDDKNLWQWSQLETTRKCISSVNHSTKTIHNITSLYRSPSQTHGKFDNFLLNFQQFICDVIARNPVFVLISGDFSAWEAKWWRNDTATSQDTKNDSITTPYSFSRIISDPTHAFPNSSSYIDFISQTNLN